MLVTDTELVWRGATHLGVNTQPYGPSGMRFPPPTRTPKLFHRWRHPVWGTLQQHALHQNASQQNAPQQHAPQQQNAQGQQNAQRQNAQHSEE